MIVGTQPEDSQNYTIAIKLAEEKDIKITYVGTTNNFTQKIKIDEFLNIDILWPNSLNLVQENPLNNNSMVCKINYKDISILFTGDIEELAEKEILEQYKNNLYILKSNILKIPHHGSITSSTKEFLEAVNPNIALIGVGKNNKFGHPNKEVLERLENLRNKNITNRSNGRDIYNYKS